MKASKAALLMLAAALALSAVLYVLNSRRDARQPTFGPAEHIPDGVPLRVGWSKEIDSGIVRDAMKDWNRVAGCTLFEPSASAPDVRIARWEGEACGRLVDAPKDVASGGGTWRCFAPAGGAGSATGNGPGWDVRIGNLIEPDRVYLGLMHELGHVLGLTHAGDGLMAEQVPRDLMPIRPKDNAVDAIRERFCR